MKIIISAFILSSSIAVPAFATEPIPGSITYGGPSRSTLSKTPVGSVHFHQFYYRGDEYREIYKVGSDHRLELVSRTVVNGGER